MISNLIASGAGKARAAKTFNIDRSKYMNASEALSCARRQWFTKHAQEPNKGYEDGWGYQERGNGVEQFVVAMLERSGAELALAWPNQKSLVSEEHRISATPDGVLVDGADAIEIKSIDPRTNVSKLPKKEHTVQLQIGMELMRMNTNHSPMDGILIYVDASDWSKILEFPVPRDEEVLDRLKPRADKILNARKAKSLDPEGALTGECKWCPFREACGDASDLFNEGQKAKKKANLGYSLDTDVQGYLGTKHIIEREKQALEEYRQALIAYLGKNKVQEVTVGSVLVQLSQVAGKRSLDRAAMEKAGIDLTPYEKTGAPSTRLTVKEL